MVTQSEINKYIKDIKKQLLYGTRETKQFLKELKQNIVDYVEENQGADMEQIMEQFGKPEDIAATFFEHYDNEEIRKKLKIRHIVVTCVIIVTMFFSILLISETIRSKVYDIAYIVEYPVEEITENTTTQPE